MLYAAKKQCRYIGQTECVLTVQVFRRYLSSLSGWVTVQRHACKV